VSVVTRDEDDSGYPRLEDQLGWYDRKAVSSQRNFKRVRLLQVALTAVIPGLAVYHQEDATAAIAVLLLVLEAMQHMNQWQSNWISYRGTCETLKHEKYVYLGRVGPYDGLGDGEARKTLVARVESIVGNENSKWIGRFQKPSKEER
jgi:hypothetical protein